MALVVFSFGKNAVNFNLGFVSVMFIAYSRHICKRWALRGNPFGFTFAELYSFITFEFKNKNINKIYINTMLFILKIY